MDIYSIIKNKRKGKALSESEIGFFVSGVTSGAVADYQAAALLMAVCIRGMTPRETADLALAMAHSGEVLKPSAPYLDKHSTGGVGDATTLIVVPALASLGIPVLKMSGRGLGHTGGTLDKLECFTGINLNPPAAEREKLLAKTGAVICGQSESLAPADKILYALRDVTATVDSLPLIAASIMSKKLALGAEYIVLDVKYGSGAFMKTISAAKELAGAMTGIAEAAGRKARALITCMEQPLAPCAGSFNETAYALRVLAGKEGESDLYAVCRALTAAAVEIYSGNGGRGADGGAELFDRVIESGAALNKLREIIEGQGGSFRTLFNAPAYIKECFAAESGYLNAIDAEGLGGVNVALGGGRVKKTDILDHAAGVEIHKRLGERVTAGERLLTLSSSREITPETGERALSCLRVSGRRKAPPVLIV